MLGINLNNYDYGKCIDYSLIVDLIKKIDEVYPKREEVLVFLPGLEEIWEQQSLLNEENYQIFVLHSRIQKDE